MMTTAPMPPVLWKYREWGRHAAAMIERGEIYFARAEELNDPFEFRWQERWPTKWSERDAIVRETLARAFPDSTPAERKVVYERVSREAEEKAAAARKNKGYAMQTMKFNLGVFSVSEICDHPLMWPHYSKNHRGVCLGIRPDRVLRKRFIPVEYSDEVACIKLRDYVSGDADLFVRLSTRKSNIWNYEREWRTIHHPGAVCCEDCVCCVIVGAQASEQTKAAVRASVKRSKRAISIHQTHMREDEYGLVIHPPVLNSDRTTQDLTADHLRLKLDSKRTTTPER